jgi:hypothetical protein
VAKDDGLSLYREIESRGFEAAIVASYNVNFLFYEKVVLPQLQAAGCRHNILLADARQCAAELGSDVRAPQLCGSEYAILPVRSGASFHPKFMLLVGRRSARVIVGSHNATLGGFGLNREIGTAFDIDLTQDGPGVPRVVWRFVKEWARDFPAAIQQVLSATERIAPWLKEEAEQQAGHVVGAALTGPPLWQLVRPRLPKRVTRIEVVSPFFDLDLRFLKVIRDEFRPKELIVAVHPEFSDIRPEAARLIRGARFVDVSQISAEWSSKVLHAKAYLFEGPSGSVAVSGSANASAAAWTAEAPHRNAELVVVHEDGARLWSRLGLRSIAKQPEMTATTWEVVRKKNVERRERERNEATQPLPHVATLSDRGFLAPSAFAERISAKQVWVVGRGSAVQIDRLESDASEVLCVCENPAVRNGAVRLEVRARSGPTRIALIHRTEALLDKAAGSVRHAFKVALSGLDGNPNQLEELLALVEKVVFDTPLDIEDRPGARAGGSRKEGLKREGDIGSLMVDARDTGRARRNRRVHAMSDLGAIIDALIYRLGIGLTHEIETRGPAKSEEELANDDDVVEREINGAALAAMCRRKINQLFRRMEKQLKLAAERGRKVVPQIGQLAVVLGVVKHIRIREADFEWVPAGEELVELRSAWSFFERTSGYLYGDGSNLAALALQEAGEEFDELTVVRSHLTWLALDCEMDTRKVLADLSEEIEEIRERLEEAGYFVPVVSDCVADPIATKLLISTVGEAGAFAHDLKDRLDYHLDWARNLIIERPQARVGDRLQLGDVVYRPKVPGDKLRVVIEVQGNKAAFLELETGERKAFVTSFLARVGSIAPR